MTKHGKWFPFDRHIDIHRNTLSGWKSSMVSPKDYLEEWEKSDLHKFSVNFEFQINGYQVQITKYSKVSFKTIRDKSQIPDKAKTQSFSYMAFNQHKNHMIRYCSPHSSDFIRQAPWHNKYHRHEYDSGQEEILIYSSDDRPMMERLKKQFKKPHHNINIRYQNTEWPHISEFLTEIFQL